MAWRFDPEQDQILTIDEAVEISPFTRSEIEKMLASGKLENRSVSKGRRRRNPGDKNSPAVYTGHVRLISRQELMKRASNRSIAAA